MRSKPRDRNIASKPAAGPSPPYDLAAIKAANRKHRWERYGKPVAPAFLPDELDQINALREALPDDVAPNAYRLSDAGVVKACFKYAVQQLLKGRKVTKATARAQSRRRKLAHHLEGLAEARWERGHS